MSSSRTGLVGLIEQFASRLRFPQLFLVTASLFLLDLLIPDFLPFVDEILLGLATLLLASWRRRKTSGSAGHGAPNRLESGARGPVIDVTPED